MQTLNRPRERESGLQNALEKRPLQLFGLALSIFRGFSVRADCGNGVLKRERGDLRWLDVMGAQHTRKEAECIRERS